MQEQRRETTPRAGHPGDPVEVGGAESRHQDRGPVVPQSRVSKESSSDAQEIERPTREVA